MKILESIGVSPIVENIMENRFWWFGHVERRFKDIVIKRADQIDMSQIAGGRGRPRNTLKGY